MRARVLFWLAWWAPLTLLWALLVFKTERAELAAGAVAAAFSATGVELVRHLGSAPAVAPGWTHLRPLARLPREIVVETGLLAAVLWRALVHREDVRGSIRRVAFPRTGGRAPGHPAHGGHVAGVREPQHTGGGLRRQRERRPGAPAAADRGAA